MSRTSDHSACTGDAAAVRAESIVFDVLKRGDSIYTAMVPNRSKAALQAVIRGRPSLSSVVHTDGCGVSRPRRPGL